MRLVRFTDDVVKRLKKMSRKLGQERSAWMSLP